MLPHCKVAPHANQIECHTRCAQRELVDFCVSKAIQPVAYSPIKGSDLSAPLLAEIGAKHGGRSPAAVALRWLLQRGIVVLPQSGKPERIAKNRLEADGWALSAAEMEQLFELDEPAEWCKRSWATIL